MIKSSIGLSLVTGFISLLSFVCQIFIAHSFGAGHRFDLYLFAISIPFLVIGASTGMVSQAFVPKLMAARSDLAGYRSLVTMLLGIALLAALLVAFAGMGLSLWSTSAMSGVFADSDRALILSMARITWFTAGVALLASALTAVHHTEGSFLLPATTSAFLYLGMIIAARFFASTRNPVVLVWGTLAGTAVSILVLLPKVLPSIRPMAIGRRQARSLGDGVGRIGLVVIANCAFCGLAPVEAFLAPKFGTGALSYLGYSQRLIIAMGAVIVAGPLVLLVPAVAKARVENDAEKVRSLSVKSIGAVCLLGALAALIFGILRVSLIQLILQHGAFDPRTTEGVAATLPWMLVGSIAMLGTQIAFRALYGQEHHAFPAIAGALVPCLYFTLGLALSRAIGFQGICCAYAITWWLVFAAVLIRLYGMSASHLRLLASSRLWIASGALSAAALSVWAAQRFLLEPGNSIGMTGLCLRCFAVASLGLLSFALVGSPLWLRPGTRKFLQL